MLEIGQAYPDPTGLAVLIPSAAPVTLTGKTVCVTGRILKVEGITALQIGNPAAIGVLDTQ
jgi:hypothetical protein